MKKKYKSSPRIAYPDNPVLSFAMESLELKSLYRQGWLHHGIPREICETVAEHSFSTALLSWILAVTFFPHLDADKVIKLALIHEVCEIRVGDLTPMDGIKAEDKYERELDAVKTIFESLPKGNYFLDLWEEFEDGKTPESLFVKQMDRFEMALQAAKFHSIHDFDPTVFWQSTARVLSDEKLMELFQQFTK